MVLYIRKVLFCVYNMLIPSLTGLQLIHLNLVLASPVTGFGLLFMVMFAGIVLVVMGVWFVITCYVPISSFLVLKNGSNIITFPPSLFEVFYHEPYVPLNLLYMIYIFHHALLVLSTLKYPLTAWFLSLSVPRDTALCLSGCCICALCATLSVCLSSSL